MICPSASTEPAPAGVSFGPSWSRITAPGTSWATIASRICGGGARRVPVVGLHRAQRQRVAEPRDQLLDGARSASKNGGRKPWKVSGAPIASNRRSVRSTSSITAGVRELVQVRVGVGVVELHVAVEHLEDGAICGLAATRKPLS